MIALPATRHVRDLIGRLIGVLAALTGVTGCGPEVLERPDPRPNFLVIQADDLGFDDVALTGGAASRTRPPASMA